MAAGSESSTGSCGSKRVAVWLGCVVVFVFMAALLPATKDRAFMTHEAVVSWRTGSPQCQLWRGRLGNVLFHYWHARLAAKYENKPLHCAWRVSKPFHLLPIALPRGHDGAPSPEESASYQESCGSINKVHYYERPGAFNCLAPDIELVVDRTRAAFFVAVNQSAQAWDYFEGRLPSVQPEDEASSSDASEDGSEATPALRRAKAIVTRRVSGQARRVAQPSSRRAAVTPSGGDAQGIRIIIHYRCGDLWGRPHITERFFLSPQYYVRAIQRADAEVGKVGSVHIIREPTEPEQCGVMQAVVAAQIEAAFPSLRVMSTGSSLLNDMAAMIGADVFVASVSTLSYWVALLRDKPSMVPSNMYLERGWVGLCANCVIVDLKCAFTVARLYYTRDLPALYASGCRAGCVTDSCDILAVGGESELEA